jgi:lipopolysaccharide transport system permease protein
LDATATLGERGSAQVTPSRPQTVIEPTRGWASLRLGEFVVFRELFFFLIWRDIKIRYRQTALGVGWVILQPLILMAVLSLFFGVLVKVPSEGVPYPIFVFAGLLPWYFFSQSLGAASGSLVANEELVSKIYLPRLLLPIASATGFLLDFVVSMVLVFTMMGIYGYWPSTTILLLPLLTALCLVTSLAVGIVLSALNVRYRDVQAGVPLLLQIWLFASPVVYPISLVPEHLQPLYGLNPMATVIGGFRWALVGAPGPSLTMVLASAAVVACLLVAGTAYFRRTERTFADVI